MYKKICKTILFIIIISIFTGVFSGCAKDENVIEKLPENTYAFVSKDVQNSYMQKLYQGFDAACRENGVQPLYKAPSSNTAQEQEAIIRELINSGVAGIAIAANDHDTLTDILREAMDKGINVISVDSAVNKDARRVHIQQADPEKIGRTLIASAYDNLGGQGGIAILSSTEYATNQNLWLEYMNREINENPEKYASTPIIETAYGDDDIARSSAEVRRLLENPQINIIVAPTTVGMAAAGQIIKDMNSSVKLIGLGIPSQMASFIETGVCQQMYLWNPVDTGYLAGYALSALAGGQISGGAGEAFNAGNLGERVITNDIEGGTEIMLGDLMEFDISNIDGWKNAF